jgi:thiol-disulfide isomerase/thioredoxin
MNSLLPLARFALILVFGVAGVAKLRDMNGTRTSLGQFGLPETIQPLGAWLLPLAELVTASALWSTTTAAWGAAASLALLMLFTVAIAVNLARGRRPACHCFGQLHSSPIGPGTVVRNVVLAAIALFVLSQGPGLSFGGALAAIAASGSMILTLASFGIAVAVFAVWAIVHLLRLNGRLLLRLEAAEARLGIKVDPAAAGLPVGYVAPSFKLRPLGEEDGPDTEEATDAPFRAAKLPTLLVFSTDRCGACDDALPEIALWQREYADRISVNVIARGEPATTREKVSKDGVSSVFMQENNEVELAYRTQATPAGVLLKDGLIASPAGAGIGAVRAILERAIFAPKVKKHDPVPSLVLTDLNGRRHDVAALAGRRAILMFWNPGCGFCREMVDVVKAWERAKTSSSPELVFIAAGTPAENREFGFRSRMLMDPTFAVARVFGSEGTPSAVVVEDGKIATRKFGAPDVLSLLNGTAPVELMEQAG